LHWRRSYITNAMGNVPPHGFLTRFVFSAAMAASIVVSLVLPSGAAQAPATVAGVVTDAQGGVLVGVTVTARASNLPDPRVVITDRVGRYEIRLLPPGAYTLTFELAGFQMVTRDNVVVPPGGGTAVDVRLSIAPLAEAPVEVVGVTPLLGTGLDRDILPAAVSMLDESAVQGRRTASLGALLNERIGSVSINDSSANPYQPDVQFRGFTASPVLGLPQGIAVYQNGVRVNEPFGDTVPFDLVPMFAIDRLQMTAGAQPVYGLNALGGSLALSLKNGFTHQTPRAEISAGSFGRYEAIAEAGHMLGRWAFYGGIGRLGESGWRVASDSDVLQAVGDAAYRTDRAEIGLSVIEADTALRGNGPAPIDLVEVDRRAVFTLPDRTENNLSLVQSRFNVGLSPTFSLGGAGYYRAFDRNTLNGDRAPFEPCEIDALPLRAPVGTLCEDGDDPLIDLDSGGFLTRGDARGDGVLNRTKTATDGWGGSLQGTFAGRVFQRDNFLVFGTSIDLADISFGSRAELGSLTPNRTVASAGRLIGVFGEAPNDQFNVDLQMLQRAVGVYFTDTLSLTARAHVTVDGRYNDAHLDIADRLGDDLNGDHTFRRFNGGVGAVYQVATDRSVYVRYGESSRTPTAAEVTCADPEKPCRVPNAFVSDPPLDQAVARSVEVGVRGRLATGRASRTEWSITAFGTRVEDDILFVASPEIVGSGFFQNAGDTQRVGLEADLRGRASRVGWYASYALVRATFESPLTLPSDPEVNEAADDRGQITVGPGDRLPGIPLHSLKGGAALDLTDRWKMGVESVMTSSQVFRGDEGNDQAPLDGYGIVNLRSSYRFTDRLEGFVSLTNLFATDYATFGVLAEVELELSEAPGADDPRFLSPGEPFAAMAGVRVRLW